MQFEVKISDRQLLPLGVATCPDQQRKSPLDLTPWGRIDTRFSMSSL